jgi:hypothetical protein
MDIRDIVVSYASLKLLSFWAPVDFAVATAYFTIALIASSRSVNHRLNLLFSETLSLNYNAKYC